MQGVVTRLGAGDVEAGGLHAFQSPAAGLTVVRRLVAAVLGVNDGRQPEVGVKFVDGHLAQAAVSFQGTDVDEAGLKPLAIGATHAVLQPQAGAEGAHARALAQHVHAQLLGTLFGHWGDPFAGHGSQHGQQHAQHQHAAQRQLATHAGRTHGGEFGVLGKLGQRVDAANQRGHGHQLVDVAGQAQQHVQHGLRQPVAALADVVQFVDEVEEGKEPQKAQQHGHDAASNLAGEVAGHQLHAVLPPRRRATSLLKLKRGSVSRLRNM